MFQNSIGLNVAPSPTNQVVHSGHFMISSVADEQEENEEIQNSCDSPTGHEQTRMIKDKYDFTNVEKETKDTYLFGAHPSKQITIDSSLARLFKCMSLAYQGGKVISPKWKNFKGMKLSVKDKIRLNNAIWRTWHIQYVRQIRKSQFIIQFATPFDNDMNSHSKPEAVVLEGVYWKRRIETVVAEYKKWRAFFINKVTPNEMLKLKETNDNDVTRKYNEFLATDFTDTLFTSLSQQPFQFPNPREIAIHATNSDMIQPGLLQLQPNVEEFMDFDAFPELFSPPRKTSVSFTGGSNLNYVNTNVDYYPDADFNNLIVNQNVVQPTQNKAAGSASQVIEFTDSPTDKTAHILPANDPMFSEVNFTPPTYQHFSKTPQHPVPPQHVIQPTDQHTAVQPQQTYGNYNQNFTSNVSTQHQVIITDGVVPVTQPMCIVNHNPTPAVDHSNITEQTNYSYNLKTNLYPQNNQVMKQNFQPHEASKKYFVTKIPHTSSSLQALNKSSTELPSVILRQRKRGSNFSLSQVKNDDMLSQNHPNDIQSSALSSKQSYLIPEKRRSLEGDKIADLTSGSRDVWASHKLPISPTSANLYDISMEQVTLEQPTSSLYDNDLTQVAQMDVSLNQVNLSNEKKRRFNIRVGFTRLQTLISGADSQSNTKVSKARMLSKAVQFIKKIQAERNEVAQEIQSLKEDVEKLQASISASQSQLPATGASLPRYQLSEGTRRFDAWVRFRTKRDWKFFLFSKVIRSWFDSYQKTVSPSRRNDFERSIAMWLRDHCSLRVLRSNIIHPLQVISTSTCILSEPTKIRQQILEDIQIEESLKSKFDISVS